MKNRNILIGWLVVVCVMSAPVGAEEFSLQWGRFGLVTIYRQKPHPCHVILFLSGDGGWNQGVVHMARELSSMDALVTGIDIVHYLKQLALSSEPCSYPAADFENFSHFVQKTLGFPEYVRPVLIGYSSGATLVYGTLAQSPPGTFLGAISMGFCPTLPLNKPFCRGSGLTMEKGPKGKGMRFLPADHLKDPWIALQGTVDQVCDPDATEAYVRDVRNGKVVMLPKVGHGFSVPKNWMPQLKQAFAELTKRQAPERRAAGVELGDLPLVEVPPAGAVRPIMAIIISGDGGWAGIDQEIAGTLAEGGVGVVGLNSLKYFWTARTPEGFAADLGRILEYYLSQWQKQQAIVIGYSMGAGVLPFAMNRLRRAIRERVTLVVLLAPRRNAQFEFHLSDWIPGAFGGHGNPVLPEVKRIADLRMLCFYGERETDSICPGLDGAGVKSIRMKGAHHLGGDYRTIAETILEEAKW